MDPCLDLEPSTGACLETQRAWTVQQGGCCPWLWAFTLGSPKQSPECVSFHSFSGGTNTGDPGGKLVSWP